MNKKMKNAIKIIKELDEERSKVEKDKSEKAKDEMAELEKLNADLKKLKEEIATKTKEENEKLTIIDERLDAQKTDLLMGWDEEKNQIHDGGWKFTRSHRRAPEVHDKNELLKACANMPKPPIKSVTFDNSKLITLFEAGALSEELVSIRDKQFIAITKPKD